MNQQEKRQAKRIRKHAREAMDDLANLLSNLQFADSVEMSADVLLWDSLLNDVEQTQYHLKLMFDYIQNIRHNCELS